MATVKYKIRDCKIFLDNQWLKNLLNRRLKNYFPNFARCVKVESKHYKVLATTSFLVRYQIVLETADGFKHALEIRGNRLNPASYKTLKYLWATHGFKKYYYPRPLRYFAKKQYVLYESYQGEVYRSWPDKSYKFFNQTIPLIAQRLADLHQTKILSAKTLTYQDQAKTFKVMLGKIKKHNPKYLKPAEQAAEKIANYLKNNCVPPRLALCHNDFQSSNLIYDPYGPRIGIIDFELMANNLPAADIANFNIQLFSTIRNALPPVKIIALQQKFIKEYKKNISRKKNLEFEQDLPYFNAKSLIDLLALYSIQIKTETGKQRQNYLRQAMVGHFNNLKKLLTVL